jgi:hydroxymethylpyrimidine/phosphomethylpyrimidine kinase
MHGTGCTLSAAITAGLAHKKDMTEAVTDAIAYVQQLIENAHTWEHNHHSIRCLGWL